MNDSGIRVVLVTAPDGEAAERLARGLVEDRLAACVNRIPGVRSVYRYEGKLCDDAECLLVIKTTAEAVDTLCSEIRERHPYDLPEVIAVPVVSGSEPYLAWVRDGVKPPWCAPDSTP